LATAVLAVVLMAAIPAPASPGVPPDIIDVLSADQTINPGETRTYDVAAADVASPAVATFSGDGVTSVITRYRSTRLRLTVTAEASAPGGLRDLTVTNPDGLSDTLVDAILVTGDVPPDPVGDVVGRVFEDVDGSGVEDGVEVGVSGVVVVVVDAVGVEWSVVTDAVGDYGVVGVAVGEATVSVSGPVGFGVTTGNEVQVVVVEEDAVAVVDPVGYQMLPPASLPGVYAEADVHFLFDARSLVLADGEPVVSWMDEIAAFELLPVESLDAPTYLATAGFDGEPSVEFDGLDDVLQVTFGELNTGDFVFHLVLETQAYMHRTVIMTKHPSGGLVTKNVIAYDDYDEDRTLRGEPAWVTMSGPDGSQAQHYHPILSSTVGDERSSPTGEVGDDANRVVITYVVRDSGQMRFWDRLDDLLDATMGAPGNDLDVGLRLGSREDSNPASFGNFRLAYLIAVDEAPYTEAELLAAATDLGEWFNVPGFAQP
jgi:hypothetical protein